MSPISAYDFVSVLASVEHSLSGQIIPPAPAPLETLVSQQRSQPRGTGSFQRESDPLVGPSDASGPRSHLGLTVAPGGSWSRLRGPELSPLLVIPFLAPLVTTLGTSVKAKMFLYFS